MAEAQSIFTTSDTSKIRLIAQEILEDQRSYCRDAFVTKDELQRSIIGALRWAIGCMISLAIGTAAYSLPALRKVTEIEVKQTMTITSLERIEDRIEARFAHDRGAR